MSEADGMDEIVEGSLRQQLMLSARLAETLARGRQEALRAQDADQDRAVRELHARIEADRTIMRAELAPVSQDRWWEQAAPDQIARAYTLAEGWKDYDPAALAAAEKIHEETARRYGINTHDLDGDAAYLQSGVEVIQAERAPQEAMREHQKGMSLIAAAQAEDLRAKASALSGEIERFQVPEDYLHNPELLHALEKAHHANTPETLAAADTEMKERMFLIGRDGINGPTIDQLRTETEQHFTGSRSGLFTDTEFVETARHWHEAKLLAEGGFNDYADPGTLQTRYQDAERALFNRIQNMGRDIEDKVLGSESGNLRGQAENAETTAAVGFGSAEHRAAFAASLQGTADAEYIKARITAAADEGAHPQGAVTAGTKSPKARKTGAGAGRITDRVKSGPTR